MGANITKRGGRLVAGKKALVQPHIVDIFYMMKAFVG